MCAPKRVHQTQHSKAMRVHHQFFVLLLLLCAGDERPGRVAADMVFVIDEKAHPRFK